MNMNALDPENLFQTLTRFHKLLAKNFIDISGWSDEILSDNFAILDASSCILTMKYSQFIGYSIQDV